MNKWEKEVQQSLLDSEEAAIKALEAQYKAALKSINEKVKLFQADIDMLDQALEQEGLDDAARAMLQSRKRSKIYQKQYQQALQSQVNSILDKMQGDNYATIDKYLKGCYETGYIGTMYDIAKQGVPIIAPINQAAVVKAVLTDSKIKEGFYNALGVSVKHLKKTITQEVSRGIASSLSYSDIARNINNVARTGLSNAKRIARTEGHRIQQTSTRDAQEAARAKGADVVKQWDAALDSRTRDSHRRVDGEIRELDEPFSNGLMFPGDPAGEAAEVINCRCTSDTRARWALNEDELKTLQERAAYFGIDKSKNFEEYREKFLDASHKMATSSDNNDWSQTVSRTITKQERAEIIQYAKEKGINIGSLKDFDGDVELLKSQIDALSNIVSELPIGKKISLSVIRTDDKDFGESSQEVIRINLKALRDRKITEMNILNGHQFASTTVEDIAIHEYGHVFASAKGNKGLEIARKAYYNVFNESASDEDIAKYLYDNISPYSMKVTGRRNLPEIIPEVLAKNNSNPSEFTQKFVELLKGI